ncbi:30S ribosomal protein S30e [Candidatus Bathyarchaeota archaeon]|nr:30S ribosomal protein S30e [Candidatus Bathyarchaeota archaeon]MBS7629991.1 30S ribosomal protein S30e [Candidatus Bathyarchaeota archaeon]
MPTHGSLTKAGKVRAQTPKIEATPKTSPIPRRRNWVNFQKRILNAPAETKRFAEE